MRRTANPYGGFVALLVRLSVAFVLAAGVQASAATYPEKPIHFVVPYSPGGPADSLMRLVGNAIAKTLGQPAIIDIRAGGNSIIGTDYVAKAAPDGYTILAMTTTHAANPALLGKLPYDSMEDFAPITLLASTPFMLTANPSLPVANIKELIALAKSRPGELNFAIGGVGTSGHLTAELFNGLAGVKVTYVPYKGAGPAFVDLVAGHVQLLFSSSVGSLPFVKSGRLKALAVTGLKRTPVAPDVPTVAESGFPGFASSSWFGVMAPAKTPGPIIDRLQQAIAAALKTEEVARVLAGQGAEPGGMAPEEFGKYYRSEAAKWGKVIRDAGIKKPE
ncbi:MAG: tripartite tricarboxylate transporter substrate binding protein [Pseudomonadota bacterium]